MKRGYYLITFKRTSERFKNSFLRRKNEEIKTIFVENSHPLIFLKMEKEMKCNTVILFYKELTKEEYTYITKTTQ